MMQTMPPVTRMRFVRGSRDVAVPSTAINTEMLYPETAVRCEVPVLRNASFHSRENA